MTSKDETKRYFAALKSFKGFAAGVGVILPASAYFFALFPPFLDSLAPLLASGIAAATLISINYYHAPRTLRGSRGFPPLVKRALWAFCTALLMLFLYLILLRLCTVVSPPIQGKEVRFQIGFGKWEPSLTEEGREVKRTSPNSTIQEWMLDDGLFKPGGPEVIWKAWMIYLAGTLTLITFVLTFVLWTLMWALLAKQKALSA